MGDQLLPINTIGNLSKSTHPPEIQPFVNTVTETLTSTRNLCRQTSSDSNSDLATEEEIAELRRLQEKRKQHLRNLMLGGTTVGHQKEGTLTLSIFCFQTKQIR
jgi:hypothetical protein